MMFVLIWALLFSERVINANTDSGSYQLRNRRVQKQDGFTFSPPADVFYEDLIQKPTVLIPPLTEGQQTTLTCTAAPVPCFRCLPEITWAWRGRGEKDSHITGNNTAFKTERLTLNRRHSSTLTFNASAEHHGAVVTCKVSFANSITTEETATLSVNLFPKILENSGCEVQSEVLTCVCISQGFPWPKITMPLLEAHTEYSVSTTVSNHTVNTSVTVNVKNRNYSTVGCESKNGIGEAKKNLTVTIKSQSESKQEVLFLLKELLLTVIQPEVIIAFVSGILFSAIICCLPRKCSRKKPKNSGNMVETLEMVTTEVAPLMDAGQSVENNGTLNQEAATGGPESAGQSDPDGDLEPKEVEYSNIVFNMMNMRSPRAEDTQETTDTEYAEIKTEGTKERWADGEILEDNEEEVEEEKKKMLGQEEEGEDMAVYSSVD